METKLKYESLEEELAQFKEEKFDLVKVFFKKTQLLALSIVSNLVLIILFII